MSAPIVIPARQPALHSPMSPSSTKKLSARRGSVSAFDPHGSHASVNNSPRSSSSRLTIVRVPAIVEAHHIPQSTGNFSLQQPDPSGRRHRRIGSNSSLGSATSQSPSGNAPVPGRMSFAFSSFGGNPKSPSGPASHGSNVAGISPSSPTSSPRSGSGSTYGPQRSTTFGNPRLSPDQLYDLAKKAANPNTPSPVVSPGPIRHGRPSSPMSFGRPSSPMRSSHSRSVSEASNSSETQGMVPATFRPMPDEVYLPFIDRPGEVASLISSAPSAKLFSLLEQTFPAGEAESVDPETTDTAVIPGDPLIWTYRQLHIWLTQVDREVAPDALWVLLARGCIMARSELIWERVKGALGVPPELDVDVEHVPELSAEQARVALRQHMDLAMGEGSYDDAFHSSDGESVERGPGRPQRVVPAEMPATGHWPGWDNAGLSSAPSTSDLAELVESINPDALPIIAADSNMVPKGQDDSLLMPVDAEASAACQDAAFSADLGDRLTELQTASPARLPAGLPPPFKTDAGANQMGPPGGYLDAGDNTTSTPAATATPKRGNSFKRPRQANQYLSDVTSPPPPSHQFGSTGSNTLPSSSSQNLLSPKMGHDFVGRTSSGHASPASGAQHSSYTYPSSPSFTSSISIEPLLGNSNASNPPPSSLLVSLGSTSAVSPGQGSDAGLQDIGEDDEEEDGGVAPGNPEEAQTPECHGLRISTSPLPSMPIIPTTNSGPHSPVVASRSSNPSSRRQSLSRSGSFGYASISRSASFTAAGGAIGQHDSSSVLDKFRFEARSLPSGDSDGSFDRHDDVPYDPVADRGPGNPLFPSNFARMSLGPTLSSNNPSLRSPPNPPANKFGSPHFTLGSGLPSSAGGPPIRGNRFNRPSWAEGWDPVKQEYAITLGGGSSVGKE